MRGGAGPLRWFRPDEGRGFRFQGRFAGQGELVPSLLEGLGVCFPHRLERGAKGLRGGREEGGCCWKCVDVEIVKPISLTILGL